MSDADSAPAAPATPATPRRIFSWLRLSLGLASVALGLLPFVPACNKLVWMLTVGVTEWGHIAALLGLALFLPGWRSSRRAKAGAILGLIGAALALSTIARASWMSESVRRDVANAFGEPPARANAGGPPRPAPFVVSAVFLGIPIPAMTPLTVEYVERAGRPLSMDLYLPPPAHGQNSEPAPSPVVVMIHGGSWRSGNRKELPALDRYLAAHGYCVAAIDYRLAPEHKFPAAIDDVRAAVDFLKANATRWNLDPRRMALLGRSAGGHLALLGAYKFHDPSIRGVAAFYAPTDLVYAYAHPSNPCVLDSNKVLEDFLGGSPATAPEAYKEAAPIDFAGVDSPATLLIHGERDDVVYCVHSERLAAQLRAAQRPCFLLRIPWGNHGCDANPNGPGGQLSLYAVERFLAYVMK